MSGREQGRRKDARVYSTYDALVCTQVFFYEKKRWRRPTTYFVISQLSISRNDVEDKKCVMIISRHLSTIKNK